MDEVLDSDHYDTLLFNESIFKCPVGTCEFASTTMGAMNYHIGRKHLGLAKLIKKKPLEDKKLAFKLFMLCNFSHVYIVLLSMIGSK